MSEKKTPSVSAIQPCTLISAWVRVQALTMNMTANARIAKKCNDCDGKGQVTAH